MSESFRLTLQESRLLAVARRLSGQPRFHKDTLRTPVLPLAAPQSTGVVDMSTMSELTDHNLRMPLQCSYCGLPFRRREHLSRHMNRHSGRRPFQLSLIHI